jgi:N-dimethylarginine dimethylaminohydrolase
MTYSTLAVNAIPPTSSNVMNKQKNILMCPPAYFDVEYEINPWMHVDNPVDTKGAGRQWQQLHDTYTRLGWRVSVIDPVPGLPDMVFTANGGLVIDDRVALPRFREPEREGEVEHFRAWFEQRGYDAFVPRHDFEGEGDALLWKDVIFAGYPWRSDKASHREIARFFEREVVSLQLTDARFYHLDTAFTVVDERTVALYPRAFTQESLDVVRARVPDVIEATDEDALAYGLNAASDGARIVLSDRACGLIDRYRERGMQVLPTPIDEFQKSGGGVKCLSLELRGNEAARL